MARPVTLFTGQWADLTLEDLAKKASEWGYDGLELACWGDHFETDKALADDSYCQGRHELLAKYGLKVWSISNHLVGQAVCDNIDDRHQSILSESIWGDGDPTGVQERAAEEMKNTARAAAKLGVDVVNGFTGSSIWHLLYSFPPVDPSQIDAGFSDFADKWNPIFDVFDEVGVKFGTADRAIEALDGRETFGFNYDPSHLGYQGVDYVAFIERLADRIYHVHMKDVWWADTPRLSGVFGGHLNFGDSKRFWDFRSIGRGNINFEEIIRALNNIGYNGPLSIEWEDSGMDREHGASEACGEVKAYDFEPSDVAFDSAFEEQTKL